MRFTSIAKETKSSGLTIDIQMLDGHGGVLKYPNFVLELKNSNHEINQHISPTGDRKSTNFDVTFNA